MDLDKLKLKTASQLLPAEKDFVRANVDKLNDEDKEAYASFLNPDDVTPEGDEGADDSGQADDQSGEGGQPDESGDDGQGAAADAGGEGAPVTPTAFSFKSEEEAREWVKKVREEEDAAKQAAIDAATTPAEKKYVEDNWKPKSWNEAMTLAVKKAKEEIRAEDEERRVKENYDKFDKQWTDLTKENNLPALTTVKGRQIHNQIIGIMRGYGLTTFKAGYDKWKKIEDPAAQSAVVSGEEGNAPVVDPAKQKMAAQKAAAAKVGGQNAGAGSIKGSASIKAPTSDDLRNKSVNKLIKEGLQGA